MGIVKDPVCGVMLEEETAKYKTIRESRVFYFDSVVCQNEFNKNPEKYLQENSDGQHASHYGGYCPTPGCGKPARGPAFYLYVGLVALILLALFVTIALTR